jgi:hypothetical protein
VADSQRGILRVKAAKALAAVEEVTLNARLAR